MYSHSFILHNSYIFRLKYLIPPSYLTCIILQIIKNNTTFRMGDKSKKAGSPAKSRSSRKQKRPAKRAKRAAAEAEEDDSSDDDSSVSSSESDTSEPRDKRRSKKGALIRDLFPSAPFSKGLRYLLSQSLWMGNLLLIATCL
ncbi:hypothetical protein F4819DRAFT_250565 [Hypoxylon fuscum]|nr:hypothetical protein F4819DRAFT_250565 [Hypoxylon fuscum]